MTNVEKLQDVQQEIDKLLNVDKISMDICQRLTYLRGAKCALESYDSKSNINTQLISQNNSEAKLKPSADELKDVAPSLSAFIENHTTENLQKLCLELQEFCQSVYALTKNDDERKIYFKMLDNLRYM